MLISQPTGAGKVAIAKWNLTNRMTIEIFKEFWQKVSPESLAIEAGDKASYNEWEDEDGNKNQGMRKADTARHGIVRTIGDDFIREATYYDDEMHGLCFAWFEGNYTFRADIFDQGQLKARIWWNADWSEGYSDGDKKFILENNGLSIFKP